MKARSEANLTVLLLVVAALIPTHGAQAESKLWVGAQGGVWNNNPFNWAPSGVPGPDDDLNLFGSSLVLGMDTTVNSITQNGASGLLKTDQYWLTIEQGLTVTNGAVFQASSNDLANMPVVSAQAGSITVSANGLIESANRIHIVDLSGDGFLHLSNGEFRGNGMLSFSDNFAVPTNVLNNEGVLTVGNVTDFPLLGAPPARTLQILSTSDNARVNLGGLDGSGVVNVRRNATLDVDIKASPFTGLMNLGHNSTVDFEMGLSLGSLTQAPATMIVDNGAVPGNPALLIPAIPADVAYIKGPGFVIDHPDSLLDMVDNDGALSIDTPLFATFGKIQHRGTLTFNANSLIGSGFDLQNTFNSSLVVNAELTVDDRDWDWDATGSIRNLTINGEGSLTTNFDNTADTSWSAVMHLNGGELNVVTYNGFWSQDAGYINVGPSTGALPSRIANTAVFQQTNGTVHVQSGGELDVEAPSTWGASLQVDGIARLKNGFTWKGANVHGTGTLRQQATALVDQDTTISVTTFDWDGGNTIVKPGVTFEVDVDTLDLSDNYYDGATIDVESGVLDVTVANGTWEVVNGGVVNLKNLGSGTPIVRGSQLRTAGSGQMTVEGFAQIEAPLWVGSGINGNSADGVLITGSGGWLNIAGPSLLLDGGNIVDDIDRSLFNSQVNLLAPLTVTQESIIDVETFDWDSASTTVEPFAFFRMLSDRIELNGSQQYDGDFTINSGKAEIDLGSFSSWIMNNNMAMSSTPGLSAELMGDHVQIGDDLSSVKATLSIGGVGNSYIDADATYKADAELTVDAGATLVHRGDVVFEGVNGGFFGEFSGPGGLILAGQNTFAEITFLEFSGGTVDLDGSSLPGAVAKDTSINANVTIAAAVLEDYGDSSFNNGILSSTALVISDNGKLTVDLDDPSSAWTINTSGTMIYNGNTLLREFLDGNDLMLAGGLVVNGKGRSGARMDITGSVSINGTDSVFRLGGLFLAGPNQLLGGQVIGDGTLSATGANGLHGHGLIQTAIDFDGGQADLMAENGELTVTGALLDVATLGTLGDSAVLNISSLWSTLSTEAVVLNGGELTGGTILNSGPSGVVGHGMVTAQVLNNTKIDAVGGLLHLNNVGSFLGGTAGTGELRALTGDLRVEYSLPTAFSFGGLLRADSGQVLETINAEINLTPSSLIDLNQGTLAMDLPASFGGSLDIAQGGPSTISNPQGFLFTGSSSNTLNSDLLLEGHTIAVSGAVFTGLGTLENTQGSWLQLDDGAIVGVPVENKGLLTIDSAGKVGEVFADSYTQTATGELAFDIEDLSLADYDRFELLGQAVLSGKLSVAISGSFLPAISDEFEIIKAAGGISGLFDTFDFSAAPLPAGLGWKVIYGSDEVLLQVIGGIQTIPGDYNNDGSVDAADYAVWRDNLGAAAGTLPNDSDGGVIGPAQYQTWSAFYGSNASAPVVSTTVPEPCALVLALAAGVMFVGRGRLQDPNG